MVTLPALAQPLRGVHEHAVARAGQVAALDQFNAHQPGQQGVLEVGRVRGAGGKHHHDRVGGAGGRRRAQRGQQLGGVAVHRVHVLLGEQRREGPGHREPVLDHVADPGGDADVVLQHADPPGPVPDQVDAGHVAADPVRRVEPGHLTVETLGRADHPPGQHPVGERVPGPVHVGEEGLQREDPLLDAPRDQVPLDGVDHPGDEVQGEGPLLARVVVGDPAVGEHPGQLVRPETQLTRIQRLQRGEQPGVGCPRPSRPLEHLIPGLGQLV